MYDYIEEANGQHCMIIIVYRLGLSPRLAGLSPENVVYRLRFKSQICGFESWKCILIWLKAEAWYDTVLKLDA